LAGKLFAIKSPCNLKQSSTEAAKFDRLQRIGYRMQRSTTFSAVLGDGEGRAYLAQRRKGRQGNVQSEKIRNSKSEIRNKSK
jgi:hypothetical protein